MIQVFIYDCTLDSYVMVKLFYIDFLNKIKIFAKKIDCNLNKFLKATLLRRNELLWPLEKTVCFIKIKGSVKKTNS